MLQAKYSATDFAVVIDSVGSPNGAIRSLPSARIDFRLRLVVPWYRTKREVFSSLLLSTALDQSAEGGERAVTVTSAPLRVAVIGMLRAQYAERTLGRVSLP